jgi:hypothetical protein
MIPFAPVNTASPPFSVSVTLDSVSYSMVTMWNLYAGRWYVSLVDQSGNIIINQPLIGSPPNYQINLFPGIFQTSTVAYYPSTSSFVINP